MELYFITTDHLEDRIWFRDEEDFKAGMNAVAVLAFILGINVLSFILMSNHVHFFLECTYEQALRFINAFKRYHSRYMRCKYGIQEMLRETKVDIQRIDWVGESPERVVAYIQMNCVSANICLSPADYLWGTGNVFFQVSKRKGIPIGSLSSRKQKQILHSKVILPAEYLLGDDGYILPESYVKVSFIESLFRNPKRMNYFLLNSSKAKRILSNEASLPAFRDQVIIPATRDLCQSLFRKTSLHDLSDNQTSELLKQLRYRFSANIDQLARVVGLSYEEVVRLLDRL